MSPPPASSGETSPDRSCCSSGPGDVLIRSTRVLLSDRRRGPGRGPGSVQIQIHRLRDPPVRPPGQQQQRRPNNAPPLRAGGQPQPGLSSGRCPGPTGDLFSGGAVRDRQGADTWTLQKPRCGPEAEPVSGSRSTTTPRPGPGPGSTKENRRPPAAEWNPDRKLAAGMENDGQPGHDLLTSSFAAGSRGVVLAALKQRSHSAPHRREVRVQLLDPQPLHTSAQDAPGQRTSSQDAPGMTRAEAGLSSGCSGDAAAAAAAVAAAAPLIKAHSDMEARVSHLAEGVQKLLQADREGGAQGRSLSQQTLHHLETLHTHQLQLQSQLLESALRIVTGHAPVTQTVPMTPDPAVTSDLPTASQQPCLQVTHLDAAVNVLSNQQRSASETRAATVEMDPVTMATPQWPEQIRADPFHQGAASVSTATQPAAGSHLPSSANHSQAVGRRANEMLREMGRLKSEMKMLLTPEDSPKTTRPGPDHHPSQHHLSQPNHFQSVKSNSHPTEPQQNPDPQIQSHQSPFQQIQSQQNQIHQIQQTQQSVLVQRRPPVPSMLEEAGRVLRRVRRQKKVLEENLEALVRAQTGGVLHCQLEALAANRDWTQEVRIKKTVDAWINTLTKDIQDEMSSEVAVHHPPADAAVISQKAIGSLAHTDRGRPVSALRGTGSRPVAGRGSRGQTAGHRVGAEPDRPTGRLSGSEHMEVDGDSYLTRLYGRAPYEGLRRTLKKSPYLRFSSPASPLSRKPRPRLVESVRAGVKVKSCKTQTCLTPPLSPSPGRPHHHHTVSSAHLISGDPPDLTVTPADSYPVPMAIPLGRPRMDSSSRCYTESRQEATSPPTAPPTSNGVAMDDRASELQTQQAEQMDAGEAPPLSRVDIMERKSEEEEDEEIVFPGTDFLSVADVVQQEEGSIVGEEAVELDGGPSPPPVLYQGPVFPPQAPSALPVQDQASVLDSVLQKDALENRLVEWVEQQLMSRMITEMYRPPPFDPAQNHSSDQSEPEEQSLISDSAEDAGLQLSVDANMSIDSALIRQLVNEVLTEQVALMLGHRDTVETGPGPSLEPPKPGPGADEEKWEPVVPTPEPTPPPSPTPPSRESPPLATPPPSEPTSLLNEESPQPIRAEEHVATPASSPEPAHSAGRPSGVHQVPPPLTWEDAELPLDEEKPEEHLETHPQPLVMSVAEEEPPLSSPCPPPPSTPPAPSPSPPRPPGPDPRPASSSSPSTESSSSSETAETDPALRHISEGELLISVNQAAMTEEEAVCSFSSSLQEMDVDPPSEGQVRGHDLLLTLLAKMEQGVTHRHTGERPQPEGSWGRDQEDEASVGEVRDDWTTNPSSHRKSTTARQGQTSPGQISECADVSEFSFEATSQGAAAVKELMVEPMGTLTSDLHTDLPPHSPSHLESTHTTVQGVAILDRQTAQRSGRMELHLPPVTPEQEESLSAADTDSSMNDVF